jgi:hypothetical protein
MFCPQNFDSLEDTHQKYILVFNKNKNNSIFHII